MNKSRKLLALAASTVTAGVLLAGCSAGGGDDASGEVTLDVFRCTGCMPFDWQIEEFEAANPTITIQVQEVPFGEFYDRTAVLATSANPPDVYVADQPTIPNLATDGVIAPLTDDLDAEYVDDMTDGAKAGLTWDGELYSPGPADGTFALYYNKAKLDAAGIAYPSTSLDEAWTWDEALAAMVTCQESNADTYGLAPTQFGDGAPGPEYLTGMFLRSPGDPTAAEGSSEYNTYYAVSADGTSVEGYLNTDEAIAGAQLYQDIFQEYKVSPTTGVPNSFLDGGSCFEVSTSTNIATLTNAEVDFEWGVTPFPYINTPITPNGSLALALGAKTDSREEAVAFITFIATPEMQQKALEETGYLPVLKSLYASEELLQTPEAKVFTDELTEWAQPRPLTAGYLSYNSIVTAAMRDIALGADPADRLNDAVDELEPLLQ
ncbi:sugar ABC transporter substrate-binding protein [Microbacterium aoyamense]|uniref:Sugar ABC transporter substrate-binding protein n=1 Tax=Microbacterium aoyamense TaxID=344166 RepID=A0ABP5AUY3_9MICO|nr:extracellular solute-binding protein [Microbacterium aoyamense]